MNASVDNRDLPLQHALNLLGLIDICLILAFALGWQGLGSAHLAVLAVVRGKRSVNFAGVRFWCLPRRPHRISVAKIKTTTA